jgi:uncharacterized protein
VNKQGRYIIPFGGLNEGEHEFNFLIDNKFFEIYEFPEIREGEVEIQVTLIKKTNLLELIFVLNGNLKVTCDRCLDDFMLPITYKTTLYVNFGSNYSEVDENIIIIPYSESQIDISQYIYEFINLSLPIRRIHPEDSEGKSLCNKVMLEKLNQYLKKIE